jgi:hypothetical protein
MLRSNELDSKTDLGAPLGLSDQDQGPFESSMDRLVRRLTTTPENNGETLPTGRAIDQAAS